MKRTLLILVLLAVSAWSYAAPVPAAKSTTTPVPPERTVQTRHSVRIDGSSIHYTATAGTLLLRNKQHQAIGSVFYIAYTEDGAKRDTRPLTFAYNGGPGAASALVDIGGYGPERIAWPKPGDLEAAQPPYRLEPNPDSILKSTDLVFIDAMGTGYSRIVGAGKPKDFYGVDADAAAFAQFIQRYIGRNHRWNSPKFLLGESYGTTRNAVLANDLVNQGVNLNGVIMCSTVLDFRTIDSTPGNDLPYISYLPSYAAVAWYYHRLNPMPPDLPKFVAQVESFAGGAYAHALFEGSALPAADKRRIADRLASYTGIPVDLWLKADLRMPLSVFQRNVLGDDRMTGRYDERYTLLQMQPLLPTPGSDNIGPTMSAGFGALTATMHSYLSEALKYHSEHPYVQLASASAWNWRYKPPLGDLGMGVGNETTCCGTNVAPALARAMNNDPAMQLMINNGWYDTATPFYGTNYSLAHMGLPAALDHNIHTYYYPVGHMLYLNPTIMPQLSENMDRFITIASKKRS
ncbi:MAG: S10 family peptidase [Rhodanobacteraceae bacterium]